MFKTKKVKQRNLHNLISIHYSGPSQLVRCNAILHPHDVPEGFKLLRDGLPVPLEADPHVIRRGMHVPVRGLDLNSPTFFLHSFFPFPHLSSSVSWRLSISSSPGLREGRLSELCAVFCHTRSDDQQGKGHCQ